MKSAQAIVEYVFLSVLAVFLAALVIWGFNLSNISASAAFGVKTKSHVITIPPMTP